MTELAKSYGQGVLSLAEIAEVEQVPVGYLEQVATPLRRAGLIEATRGAHGGYSLAVPPQDVTVGAVIRALEGPVAPVECLQVEYAPGSCVRESVCLSRGVWARVKASVDEVLDSMTLADLCCGTDGPDGTFIPADQVGTLAGSTPNTNSCFVAR
jgi:Rrf2 family transcriptional regulator, cysteine metabolism repressor